jgi:hypothetical protein
LEETFVNLKQLGFRAQAQRFGAVCKEMVAQLNSFAQHTSCGPNASNDDEGKKTQTNRSLLIQAISDVTKSALDLRAFLSSNKTLLEQPSSFGTEVKLRTEERQSSLIPATSPGPTSGDSTHAVPLTGDEATDMVNKMLSNKPPWDWKHTRKWLEGRGVQIHTRDSWKSRFNSDPPKAKGQVALICESAITSAIREECKIRNIAFETMDNIAHRHRK